MRIGDPVEVRRYGAVLGTAHIAATPFSHRVVIAAAPRILPTGKIEAPREHLTPTLDGGWVLDLH
jgi:hypothetical protein